MENDLEIATEVSLQMFGELPPKPPWLVGKGLVNRVIGLPVHGTDYAIRYSTAYENGAWNVRSAIAVAAIRREYKRETWCFEQAAKVGIPGPQIVGLGTIGDRIGYSVQTLVEGQKARKFWLMDKPAFGRS